MIDDTKENLDTASRLGIQTDLRQRAHGESHRLPRPARAGRPRHLHARVGLQRGGRHVQRWRPSTNATTNSSGVAPSPPLTANTTAGSFSATAGAPGVTPASYTLTNKANGPASISAGAGASQTAPTSGTFPIPLAVTVTDANNNPVPDAAVTFTAPASGASGTFSDTATNTATASTDSAGVTVASAFAANSQTGGYIVIAAVTGSTRPPRSRSPTRRTAEAALVAELARPGSPNPSSGWPPPRPATGTGSSPPTEASSASATPPFVGLAFSRPHPKVDLDQLPPPEHLDQLGVCPHLDPLADQLAGHGIQRLSQPVVRSRDKVLARGVPSLCSCPARG